MSELSELFARDPLSLTTEDIRKIIERMRQSHAQFELGVKAPVAERKKKTAKSAGLLDELGLGNEPKDPKDLLKDLGL